MTVLGKVAVPKEDSEWVVLVKRSLSRGSWRGNNMGDGSIQDVVNLKFNEGMGHEL
jgi:hypothetical protein